MLKPNLFHFVFGIRLESFTTATVAATTMMAILLHEMFAQPQKHTRTCSLSSFPFSASSSLSSSLLFIVMIADTFRYSRTSQVL